MQWYLGNPLRITYWLIEHLWSGLHECAIASHFQGKPLILRFSSLKFSHLCKRKDNPPTLPQYFPCYCLQSFIGGCQSPFVRIWAPWEDIISISQQVEQFLASKIVFNHEYIFPPSPPLPLSFPSCLMDLRLTWSSLHSPQLALF